MANLGYVNRFGSGVNTVSALLEENGSKPATFLLGDITTFKVVVSNADVIENGADVIEKPSGVIVNVTESGEEVRDDESVDVSRMDQILSLMRHNKRISVRQIAHELDVTSRTIFREIDKLKSEGRVVREGSDRSGTWLVK